jgi:hypothetical protein
MAHVAASSDSKAQLDRVIPTLGYTANDVAVICSRCNRAKQNSTVDDLLRIIRYVEHHVASATPAPPIVDAKPIEWSADDVRRRAEEHLRFVESLG